MFDLRRPGVPALGAVVCWAFFTTAPAASQTLEELRDALRGSVRETELGSQLQGLTGFAALPGIAAASFDIDGGDSPDVDVTRLSVPLSHEFDQIAALNGDLYVELTLGYSATSADLVFGTGEILETRVNSTIRTFSAIAGVGLTFTIAEGTTARPIALVGYAHLDDDANLAGPGSDVLEPVTDGIITNFDLSEFIYGVAFELAHERTLIRDIDLEASARYNHIWTTTLDASDDSLEGDADLGVFTAALTLDGPLGARVLGGDLRWVGFVTNSTFPGLAGEALGVDYFFELGAGLGLDDLGLGGWLESVSVRASYIIGDNTTGYSVGGVLSF